METTISPSPAQLALALAIVKSKPAGRDLKEYILQIRASIKPSRPAEVFHSPEKFFDSVSFWKQAYEKSEVEQSKLHDCIFELEQRNQELAVKLRLQNNIKAERIRGEDTQTALEKLKRPATSTDNSRKRPKTQLGRTGYASVADVRTHLDDLIGQLRDSRKSTSSFIRHTYTLRKTLQKRWNDARIIVDAVALCRSCENEITSAIPENTSKDKMKKMVPTESQMSHLSLVLRGAETAVGLLLQAVKKLSKPSSDRKEVKILIYHVVCLYEAGMNSLKRYCKAVSAPAARPALSGEAYAIQTRSKTTRRTIQNAESDNNTEIRDEGAMQVSSLLCRMMIMLDLCCIEHRQLLEGFLYILLSRAGKTLCLFVFQGLQLEPSLRADPDSLPIPAGLVGAELDDKSLGGAQMNAVYLVWLLRKALTVLDAQPSSSGAAPLAQSDFMSSIKARLQSTLVQSVFGEDSSFGPALERPTQPEGLDFESFLKRQTTYESSVPEWYIQEVWDLLGWDMLRENNGL
ncbi:hypothetical protein BDV06DRAFT_230054 [Aspergillus oleicola]